MKTKENTMELQLLEAREQIANAIMARAYNYRVEDPYFPANEVIFAAELVKEGRTSCPSMKLPDGLRHHHFTRKKLPIEAREFIFQATKQVLAPGSLAPFPLSEEVKIVYLAERTIEKLLRKNSKNALAWASLKRRANWLRNQRLFENQKRR